MTSKLASEITRGDVLIFTASNGRTRARVQKVEDGSELDVLGPDMAGEPRPMVRIHVSLQRAVYVPDVPEWRTRYWTLYQYPDDVMELCHMEEAR